MILNDQLWVGLVAVAENRHGQCIQNDKKNLNRYPVTE
jgi:hypothetical protein